MQNPTLIIAVTASLLIHAVLILVHFVTPPPAPAKPVDMGLDIILVNAKQDQAPLQAQALAQANLDGGGNADQGRATSPLPDMRNSEDGDAIRQTERRIKTLEKIQLNLLSQANKSASFSVPDPSDKTKTTIETSLIAGADDTNTKKAIARMAAEIAQEIEDQNKRPHKTFITPRTKAVGYALYYKNMQRRIEKLGTLRFPEQHGQKLYGELIVYIPIFQDGTIYEKEGGPRIEKSSGTQALDEAALRIVRDAAPFGRFPEHMRSTDNDDIWVVIARFNFTNNADLVTELKNAS